MTTATSVFFTIISLADNLPSMILREQCYERMNTPTAFRDKFPGKQWEGASNVASCAGLARAFIIYRQPGGWAKKKRGEASSTGNSSALFLIWHEANVWGIPPIPRRARNGWGAGSFLARDTPKAVGPTAGG
jgi:hypothetical protein